MIEPKERMLYQVVPRLPPILDGIGDYAVNLAKRLQDGYGWQTHFIVGDPTWKSSNSLDGFSVSALKRRSTLDFVQILRSLSPGLFLLHYAGYGYANRGTPLWLSRGLRRWLAGNTANAVLTCFHEIWASGPPWSSAFYLHPWQRLIVRQIARLSTAALTSTRRMQQLLEKGSAAPVFLPIPSNVVHEAPPSSLKRTNPEMLRLVIFGQTGSRLKTVRAHHRFLTRLREQGLVKEIVVIGQGAGGPPEPSDDVRALGKLFSPDQLRILGQCPPGLVQSALNEADLYLSFCPAFLACKSTTFMTALALGCPAVLTEGRDPAPLKLNEHFLACDGSARQVAEFLNRKHEGVLNQVAARGQEWYRRHADWPIITNQYQGMLREITGRLDGARD